MLRNFLLRLPAELKYQMKSHLDMKDIRSLRLTSASDHAAVEFSESGLVAGWLKRPLYAFASRLFPAEQPEDRLKFDYFRNVCRRCRNVEKFGKGVAVKSFGDVVDSTKFANVHQNLQYYLLLLEYYIHHLKQDLTYVIETKFAGASDNFDLVRLSDTKTQVHKSILTNKVRPGAAWPLNAVINLLSYSMLQFDNAEWSTIIIRSDRVRSFQYVGIIAVSSFDKIAGLFDDDDNDLKLHFGAELDKLGELRMKYHNNQLDPRSIGILTPDISAKTFNLEDFIFSSTVLKALGLPTLDTYQGIEMEHRFLESLKIHHDTVPDVLIENSVAPGRWSAP